MRILLKKQSRLKKLNEFIDGFMSESNLISIFKNPTSKEIEIAKSERNNNAVRGVIDGGTQYCWNGGTLHFLVNDELTRAKSNLKIKIMNVFRFAYEPGRWIFDAHETYTVEEMCNKILQNESELSKYGNTSELMDIFFVKPGQFDNLPISPLKLIDAGIDITDRYIGIDDGIDGVRLLLSIISQENTDYNVDDVENIDLIETDYDDEMFPQVWQEFKQMNTESSRKNNKLKKKAQFSDGLKFDYDTILSLYENPTSQEIQLAKSEYNNNDCIRGVIYDDGTEYCWNGEVLHYEVNQQLSRAKSKQRIKVNDSFRFAYEDSHWIFDVYRKHNIENACNNIVKNSNKLSRYGNIYDPFEIYFLKQNLNYSFNEESLSDIGITFIGDFVTFSNGIDTVEELLKIISEKDNKYILNDNNTTEETSKDIIVTFDEWDLTN